MPVVEGYLFESYSRSLTPLEIIFAIPVADARLAEKILHHVLAPHRIHQRHELFDLTSHLDDLEQAKRTVQLLDEQSGLPVAQVRPVSIPHSHTFGAAAKQLSRSDGGRVARDAAQEGVRRNKHRQEELRAAMLKEEKQRMKEEKAKQERARQQQEEEQAEAVRVQEQRRLEDMSKMKELYDDYSDAYRTLQRDKQTFKDRGSFQTGVASVLL